MDLQRAFVAAGGLLLAGSDPVGIGGVIPGFGDQREIELLVEAGFAPVEAIRIATFNGATFLGRANEIGSITVGKNADLVVMKGDPAARISDIENVELVFKDGVGYDPKKLLGVREGTLRAVLDCESIPSFAASARGSSCASRLPAYYGAYTSPRMCMHQPRTMPPASPTNACAAGTLRRASRSVSRFYDGRLAGAGLTTTQFSLLRALERHGTPMALTQLAEEQVFERSSLYRALEPLRRQGLVKLGTIDGGRAKEAELTARGRQRILRALPCWREAQNEFLKQFGRSAWGTLSPQLVAIVDAAHGLSNARSVP